MQHRWPNPKSTNLSWILPIVRFPGTAGHGCCLYSCPDLRFGVQMPSQVYGHDCLRRQISHNSLVEFCCPAWKVSSPAQSTVPANGLQAISLGIPTDELSHRAYFFENILTLIILRILTSQVFSKFILPHTAVECPETHSAISAEMALISKKTASRVPGSRFCQLIFLFVEEICLYWLSIYYAIINENCANKPHYLRRTKAIGGMGGQTNQLLIISGTY